MGMYNIECPKCSRHHMWFSGNTDQRCVDCVDYTKGPDNTVTYEIPGDPRITLPAAPSVCDHLWTVLPTYPPKPGPCAKCAAAAPDFAIREEPKPASAPREWWLVKETEESIHHYVLYSPPLEMLPQPFEVVPVIEKSVYKRLKRVLDDTVKTSHEAVEMFKAENAALLKTITDDEQLKVAQAQNAELKDEITNSNKFAQDQENTIAELRAENTRISVENTNLMHKSPSAKMALQIGNIKDELTAARAEVADLKSDAGQLILKFSSMQALGAERDKFKAALELIENAGEYICDDEGLAIECPNFHVAREALAKEQTK